MNNHDNIISLNQLREKAAELLRTSISDPKTHRKYELIVEILSDDDCFLNIDIEHAYAILRDLGTEESALKSTYSALIFH